MQLRSIHSQVGHAYSRSGMVLVRITSDRVCYGACERSCCNCVVLPQRHRTTLKQFFYHKDHAYCQGSGRLGFLAVFPARCLHDEKRIWMSQPQTKQVVLSLEVVLSLDSYPHPPTKQKFVSCFIPLFKIIWFSFDNMLLKQCSWGTPHVET